MFKRQPNAAKPAGKGAATNKGKPVLVFFLPFVILLVALVTGLGIGIQWLAESNVDDTRVRTLEGAASSLAHQVSRIIAGKIELMETLASQPATIEALKDGASAEAKAGVERRLLSSLSGAISAQLIPKALSDDALPAVLANSFASSELHQKVLKTEKRQPVEALRGTDKKEVIVIVIPVRGGDQVLGTLFVRYPLSLITPVVGEINIPGAAFAIEQELGGGAFRLAASEDFGNGPRIGEQSIENTAWKLSAVAASASGMGLVSVLVAVALAIALLLVTFFLAVKALSKALKDDLGLTVTLMDSTLKRKGTPSCVPKIQESAAAIELLTKYAQATFFAAKADGDAKGKVGMPQHVKETNVADSVESDESDQHLTENQLPMSMFSECGILASTIDFMTPAFAQALGQAMGTRVLDSGGSAIFVSRDAGLSSEQFSDSLIAGALASGCNVVDIGCGPWSLLSFAAATLEHSSGVMVTQRDAPDPFMGFRVILSGAEQGAEGLEGLRDVMLSGDYRRGAGKLQTRNVSSEYIRQVGADIQVVESKKVVVDAGNGAAGSLMCRLLESLSAEVIPLFCEPDGNYPNHRPDLADPSNLSSLILEVQAQGADFGVALNSDGTAFALVDEQGREVGADQVFSLMMADVVRRQPGADVVYDLEMPTSMAGQVLAAGGRPVMAAGNPCAIMEKILESDAVIGGTGAGQLFFKDRWFGFDDAIYGFARLLEVLAADVLAASDCFAHLPTMAQVPRMGLAVESGQLDAVIQAVRQYPDFASADVTELDGVRIEFPGSWVSIRPDVQQSRLLLKMAAEDLESLATLQTLVAKAIKKSLPQAKLPF